jgi:hypothetical protein
MEKPDSDYRDEYRAWQRFNKERVFAMVEEVWEQTRLVSEEELQADIDQAVAMLRKELADK